jgi:hypothetical protein
MKRTILPSLIYKVAGPAHMNQRPLLALGLLVEALDDGFAQRHVPRRTDIYHNVMFFRKRDNLVLFVEGAVDDALDAGGLGQVFVEGFVAQKDRDWDFWVLVLKGQHEVCCNHLSVTRSVGKWVTGVVTYSQLGP